jgi:catechol 1,2-dioxygenase
MQHFSEEFSAEVVKQQYANCKDIRLKTIMESAVTHLHEFVKEVEPTQEEWMYMIEYLTKTGQKCDDKRQEFILLSDVLGISALVDTINNRKTLNATESTVLGPFHVKNAPIKEMGDNINYDGKGEPAYIFGSVTDTDGNPIDGAEIDVWQANEDGFYDIQQPDVQPEMNLRGIFSTKDDGKYWFKSVKPKFYSIPTDGPVGTMINATGRHPNRPAHLHYIVSAEGYKAVVTHVFVKGSEYLDSDAVFGVKNSLISEYVLIEDEIKAKKIGFDTPYFELEFNFVLEKITI